MMRNKFPFHKSSSTNSGWNQGGNQGFNSVIISLYRDGANLKRRVPGSRNRTKYSEATKASIKIKTNTVDGDNLPNKWAEWEVLTNPSPPSLSTKTQAKAPPRSSRKGRSLWVPPRRLWRS